MFCIISPTSYRYAFLSAKQRTSTLSKKLSWYKLEFKVVSRTRDHLVALSQNCQRPYQVPNPKVTMYHGECSHNSANI